MSIAREIKNSIVNSSWIRKMFEEGLRLKSVHGENNVFDFSIGNPDVDPPKEFFDRLIALSQVYDKGVHGYMPNAGFNDVRNSIAEKVSKEHKISISLNNIIMTCGAAGGLNTVFKTILDPGDEVIVPKPYFVEYGYYISNHNGKMITVETNNDFSLNINNIKAALSDKTKAVLINSPNNPTGRVYNDEQINALCSILKNNDIYLISDEPYRDIIYDNIKVPSILKAYHQSIIVTSYSKTLSIPGERIGYIAVNPACTDNELLMGGLIFSNRILGYVNAPALMQRIVSGLNNAKVKVEIYKKRRDLFYNGLINAGYDCIKPDGAFYLFCKSPIQDDIKFVRHLQDYNILVVPGVGFGTPGYFRIAYCISENIIKKALPLFKKAREEI